MIETIGPYRVTGLLGRGAMGQVYRCEDPVLKRTVAVKLLAPRMAEVPECIDRFEQEICTLASLNHPNVVRAYTLGRVERSLYVAMECVDGGDLAQRLREGGRLGRSEALRVAHSAARGLQAAEALGVKHADVKASNILISGEGEVKLVDFGLAEPILSDLTPAKKQRLVGTPHYMAPEVVMGQASDHRADMYSLGITLYLMLVGKLPFTGTAVIEVLKKQVNDALPNLAHLISRTGEEVATVLRRLSAKKPDQRYSSWSEVVRVLHEAQLAGERV